MYIHIHSVDGRNPAPVNSPFIPLFTGFYTSQCCLEFLPSTVSLISLNNNFSFPSWIHEKSIKTQDSHHSNNYAANADGSPAALDSTWGDGSQFTMEELQTLKDATKESLEVWRFTCFFSFLFPGFLLSLLSWIKKEGWGCNMWWIWMNMGECVVNWWWNSSWKLLVEDLRHLGLFSSWISC